MVKQSKENLDVCPEIIIGLTGGIGCDFDAAQQILKEEFSSSNYATYLIKLSECINDNHLLLTGPAATPYSGGYYQQMVNKMQRCTNLRERCKFNGLLALAALAKIMLHRREQLKLTNSRDDYKIVYIIRSLKRPEEFNLLRKVYGRNFIMLSLYSSEETRLKNLVDSIEIVPGLKQKEGIPDTPSSLARKLIDNDLSDISQKEFGQDLEGTFQLGHYFINIGKNREETRHQVKRFIRILFGDQFVTPNSDELNMYLAHGFSLKSADLNRQIGAVVCNDTNDLLAIGCNEVPKFGGGYYWDDADAAEDHRSFQIGYDSNEKIKSEIRSELDNALKVATDNGLDYGKLLEKNKLAKLKWENLIEYGRTIHAEEAAICEAARKGISLVGSTLYTTTFPCHLCTALILAVGIKEVVFIEPYPKSKADEIFAKNISVEPLAHEKVSGTLCFRHFIGVSPRRYKHAFRYSTNDREEKITECNYKRARSFSIDMKSIPRHLKGRTFLSYILKESILINQYS